MATTLTMALVLGPHVPDAGAADDGADALAKRGVELRRQGKDQAALEQFQRAYAERRSARFLAQIALAEQALGLWVPAHEHIREALADKTESWIVKNRATLEKARTEIEAHIGTIEVWGEPAGAEVLVNKKLVGTLPLSEPLRVPEGTSVITVRAPNHVESTRSLTVASGTLRRENFALPTVEAAAPPPEVSSTRVSPAPPPLYPARPAEARADGTVLSADARADRSATNDSPPVFRRWWFWPLVGLVAVSAAAGGYFLLSNRQEGGCSAADAGNCSGWR